LNDFAVVSRPVNSSVRHASRNDRVIPCLERLRKASVKLNGEIKRRSNDSFDRSRCSLAFIDNLDAIR
jgi:hypothetical protein